MKIGLFLGRFLILLVFVVTFSGYASDKVLPKVAGVEMGSTYNYVKKTLDSRFGPGSTSDSGHLVYYNVDIGGLPFDCANFAFVFYEGTYYLDSAELYTLFDPGDVDAAKLVRDYYKSVYEKKYYLDKTATGSDGFKYYGMGAHPYDESKVSVLIGCERTKNKLGEKKICVYVRYVPMGYGKLDDEI